MLNGSIYNFFALLHHHGYQYAAWSLVAAAAAVSFLWLQKKKKVQLPPGPFQWPFIGCLPALGFRRRHRTLYELSKIYGPVIRLPIGSANLVAVHGPAMAAEVLKAQDSRFCSRPLCMTGRYLGFDHQDLNLSPYNGNWKTVRKAFTAELLSPSRLSLQAPARRDVILTSVHSLLSASGGVVNITKLADEIMTGIILRLLFGNRYNMARGDSDCHRYGEITAALQGFEPDLREGIFLWGELNLADFFPVLAGLDLQGLERRFEKLASKLGGLFQLIIDEHRDHLKEPIDSDTNDFIDVLLTQYQLSDKQIMGILSNTLIAGIDTTARAIEWAMAEMVKSPETLGKAQEELDREIGQERLMEECDIPRLPYLQAVAKEILRLHPSAPLDDPHLNEQPATLAGYHIPAQSIVLVNLWALGQDPSLWENPCRFDPDRFLNVNANANPNPKANMNVNGNDYELLPFSSGRRRCPAYHMATLVLHHVLGVLVHAFDWAPPPGLSANDISLEEGDGIVVGLKYPLVLAVKPRLPQWLLR